MTTSLQAIPWSYVDPHGRELAEYEGCPRFADGSNSQGWFSIGSECAKKLPKGYVRLFVPD